MVLYNFLSLSFSRVCVCVHFSLQYLSLRFAVASESLLAYFIYVYTYVCNACVLDLQLGAFFARIIVLSFERKAISNFVECLRFCHSHIICLFIIWMVCSGAVAGVERIMFMG